MKDKRTPEQIASHNKYLQSLKKDGVVICSHKVVICPPHKDDSAGEKVWTLIIRNIVPHIPNKDFSVVVAWHKTRAGARLQAKKLRTVLKTK